MVDGASEPAEGEAQPAAYRHGSDEDSATAIFNVPFSQRRHLPTCYSGLVSPHCTVDTSFT